MRVFWSKIMNSLTRIDDGKNENAGASETAASTAVYSPGTAQNVNVHAQHEDP